MAPITGADKIMDNMREDHQEQRSNIKESQVGVLYVSRPYSKSRFRTLCLQTFCAYAPQPFWTHAGPKIGANTIRNPKHCLFAQGDNFDSLGEALKLMNIAPKKGGASDESGSDRQHT